MGKISLVKIFRALGFVISGIFYLINTLFIEPVKLVNEINELTPERFNYFQIRDSLTFVSKYLLLWKLFLLEITGEVRALLAAQPTLRLSASSSFKNYVR